MAERDEAQEPPSVRKYPRIDSDLLRLLVESVTDYAIFVLDPDGNVASWNPGAERIKGYRAEEIIGRHFSKFYPQEAVDRGWPAHELQVAASVGRFEDEGWRVRKDGTLFWANVVITALRDEQGQLRGFAKVTRDLTARKQAEENARRLAEETAARQVANRERERLRVTLASIGDAVISTDSQGRVDFLNPVAEMLVGRTSAEAAGRNLEEVFRIVNETTRRTVENPALRALREGTIVGLANHTVLIAKDGTERPIDDSAAPIRNEHGDISGSVLVFRDVTERRREERRRNARLAVTSALSAAATAQEGTERVLEAVCEKLDWDVGFLWVANEDESALACRCHHHRPGVPVRKFEHASRCRTFSRGEGLPGRVWASLEPAWILDVATDPSFARASSAAEEGLHSAFACPIFIGSRFLGVIEFFARRIEPPDAGLLEMMRTVAGTVGQFLVRRRAEEGLREQTANAETLLRVGGLLAEDLDLHRLVQTVTDEGTRLCGAEVGAFFYNMIGERGETYSLYTLSGLPREVFDRVPMPRSTELFGPTFRGEGVVRLDDVTQDPRYGKAAPYYGMPSAHLRVKSYLAVPVVSRAGEVFGGLFFGHAEAGVFTQQHERLLVGIAGQAAVAIDNARLHQRTQASAERLNLALTAADLGDWSWEAAGDVVTFSERAAEVFGIPAGPHMTWKEMQRLIHEADRERAREEVERVIAERAQYDIEYRVDRLDGSQVWVGVLGRAIYDDSGNVTGMFGVVRDVTDRKRSEAELQEAKRRFEAVFNQQFQFMVILTPDGRVLQANETCFAATGFRREQVVGRLFWESPWWSGLPHVRRQWQEHICRAAQGAGPVTGEVDYRTADGTTRHATSVVNGLKDEAGRVVNIIVEGHDDTERRRAEQTARFLADASAALALLVDFDSALQKVASLAVPHFADWASVDVLEDDGNLRQVAAAHVDPGKSQPARDLYKRFPPNPSAPSGVWKVLRTGQAEIVPKITDDLLAATVKGDEFLRVMRELGARSYIGVPLTVRGKTLGVLTFIVAESDHVYDESDLAAAKDLAGRAAIAVENAQLYRELTDADRRKDEFLATLAHELRNPLAPIRNGLQVLRLAGGGGEMAEEARSMMERQLGHMVRLVDDLLDVSRITRNKLELRRERVALGTVIHTAVETSRPLIEQLGHTFSVTLTPTPVYLNADPVRLAQVFSNLLNNAAKYTEPGGRITLTAEEVGTEAVVRVHDDGLGIPAEAQARIFEMFSQVDRNIERAQGGLGIGLTLVRRLTEMHGGTVGVASEGPGKGSEFTVRIPLLKEVEQDSAGRAASPGAVAGTKRRILVVDDNRDAAESLAMMLRLMGNDVGIAADGLAAVEAAEEYRPELILLDIGLPKLNGYEACRRIREQAWSEGVVIVALTGWGQDEDRRRSQEAGFDHHLVKPVDVSQITQTLARMK